MSFRKCRCLTITVLQIQRVVIHFAIVFRTLRSSSTKMRHGIKGLASWSIFQHFDRLSTPRRVTDWCRWAMVYIECAEINNYVWSLSHECFVTRLTMIGIFYGHLWNTLQICPRRDSNSVVVICGPTCYQLDHGSKHSFTRTPTRSGRYIEGHSLA